MLSSILLNLKFLKLLQAQLEINSYSEYDVFNKLRVK